MLQRAVYKSYWILSLDGGKRNSPESVYQVTLRYVVESVHFLKGMIISYETYKTLVLERLSCFEQGLNGHRRKLGFRYHTNELTNGNVDIIISDSQMT